MRASSAMPITNPCRYGLVFVSSNVISSFISAATALPCAAWSFIEACRSAPPFFSRCFATMPRNILLFAIALLVGARQRGHVLDDRPDPEHREHRLAAPSSPGTRRAARSTPCRSAGGPPRSSTPAGRRTPPCRTVGDFGSSRGLLCVCASAVRKPLAQHLAVERPVERLRACPRGTGSLNVSAPTAQQLVERPVLVDLIEAPGLPDHQQRLDDRRLRRRRPGAAAASDRPRSSNVFVLGHAAPRLRDLELELGACGTSASRRRPRHRLRDRIERRRRRQLRHLDPRLVEVLIDRRDAEVRSSGRRRSSCRPAGTTRAASPPPAPGWGAARAAGAGSAARRPGDHGLLGAAAAGRRRRRTRGRRGRRHRRYRAEPLA